MGASVNNKIKITSHLLLSGLERCYRLSCIIQL